MRRLKRIYDMSSNIDCVVDEDAGQVQVATQIT